MKRLFLLFPIILIACVHSREIPKNDLGLEVVNDVELYKDLVKSDSDQKLVNLEEYIPNVKLDIRYATENNFTGQQIYKKAEAWARKPVAEALLNVQESLSEKGIGLIIYDAYRPYDATVLFYEVYKDPEFVADPKYGSRHNRGCAVDVSLYNLENGRELNMPTPFDEFSEKAAPDYQDMSDEKKFNRRLLIDAMAEEGFTVYPSEWWHFDYKGWEAFPIMNIEFEKLNL